MSTRILRLGLALSFVLAACVNNGDDTPPPGDDTAGTPDASPAATPDAPPAACANLAGRWQIGGQCGADLCTITQVGCAITQVSCTSGAHSTSGSITGNAFSYTGQSGGGVDSTCSGTAAGDALSGSCTVSITSCTFTGTRL